MVNEKQVLGIPYGTRDFLPTEAAGKRAIETKLAALFALWGYDEVVTPTIEYFDTLTMDSGRQLAPQLFKIFDKGGKTLALRHEMTTPIARVVASRLKDAPLPLKLSYISSVFRSEQSQMGRQCEFYQAGVELIGSASATADAEVLALAIQSLLRAGLKDFSVCLGQVEFVTGIMQQYRLDEQTQQTLKKALEQHDLVAYDATVASLNLAAAAKQNLRQLPVLSGGEETLQQAYASALGEQSRRALDNLSAIYHLLASYGLEKYVRFDLGLIREAIDLGFTSIMYDGSHLPDDENRAVTAQVAHWCHDAGITIEAELGEVGGKDGVHAPGVRTDTDDAAKFVADTGVDLLAVAVGSSHAMTSRDATLDFDLVSRIATTVPVPLVLHGSSGVSDENMVLAIQHGMTKINVSTHLNHVFTSTVRAMLAQNPELVDTRKWIKPAATAMKQEVARLLSLYAGGSRKQ